MVFQLRMLTKVLWCFFFRISKSIQTKMKKLPPKVTTKKP